MDRFPLLPHWALIHAKYDFDDVESGTATEMTARLYKTIKNLIDDYNEFIDEVNKTISEFLNSTDADKDEFMKHIDKVVHDYIIALDMKYDHQDKVIEDAVSYLKTNLGDSITEAVRELSETGELNEYIMGAFESIFEGMNNLTNKYNTLDENITHNNNSIFDLDNAVKDIQASIVAINEYQTTQDTTIATNKEIVNSLAGELANTDTYLEERIDELDGVVSDNANSIAEIIVNQGNNYNELLNSIFFNNGDTFKPSSNYGFVPIWYTSATAGIVTIKLPKQVMNGMNINCSNIVLQDLSGKVTFASQIPSQIVLNDSSSISVWVTCKNATSGTSGLLKLGNATEFDFSF